MYYFITLLLLSVASFQFVYTDPIDADDLTKKMDGAIAKCKENTALSEETVVEIANIGGQLKTQEEKCLAGCILEEIGVIKGNTYDWKLHSSINQKEKKQIENCKGIENADKCELAYEIVTCVNKKAKDHSSSEESHS